MSETKITEAARRYIPMAEQIIRENISTRKWHLAALLTDTIATAMEEARASAMGENKAWVEAVTAIIARCEALEDEAANELVKAGSEHAQGYCSGQKITAKSIRRELHDLTRALRSGEREG